MAITDHDTVSGIPEALEAARLNGITLLPGVEISASYGSREVHVLGLGIDIAEAALTTSLEQFREERAGRAIAIIKRLNEIGVPITNEEVVAISGEGTIGRMHIARAIHARGIVSNVQEAFDRFIGGGQRAFVKKPTISVQSAIDLIHAAHGLAFVAHPGIGTMPQILRGLLKLPFDGIEVWHSRHHPQQSEEFQKLAEERNLLMTGGSDCHGTIKGHQPEMGKVRVPYCHFERICQRLAAQ